MRWAVLFFGATGAACSTSSGDASPDASSDAGGTCAPFASDADLATPPVAFRASIVPFFLGTCAAGGFTCHGDPGVRGAGRAFLGLADGGTDAASIHAEIVGAPSIEDPAMNLVTAGDPAKSYLMHKLDDDQCTLAADCAKGTSPATDCGWRMPYRAPVSLPVPTRDMIRRWIAQGALDN